MNREVRYTLSEQRCSCRSSFFVYTVRARACLLSGVCHRLPASLAVAVVSDQVAWDRRSDSQMSSCLE